jgi:hypothetical protein
MRGGRGFVDAPPGSVVIIDPQNKVLRQDDAVDRFQAYRAAARSRPAVETMSSRRNAR